MDINPGTSILLLLLASLPIAFLKGRRLLRRWRAFQAWEQLQLLEEQAAAAAPAVEVPRVEISSETVPGAGGALLSPPHDFGVTLAFLRAEVARERAEIKDEEQRRRHGRFAFPIGWHLAADGRPDCVWDSLSGGVNHILISGQTEVGKDNAALNMLLALAHHHPASELQICIIDGKGGLDWKAWSDRAHLWRLARRPHEIRDAADALTAERERRTEILWNYGVAKWDDYRGREELPLLVVYVAEMVLLESALKLQGESKGSKPPSLDEWLNQELVSARALGIRYILATQTATNMATRWRGQIGLSLAGFQASQSQDAPNTGLNTGELVGLGAVPPSQLPATSSPQGRGIFTAVQGREVVTVRTVDLPSSERTRLVTALPKKPDDFLLSLLGGTDTTKGPVTREKTGTENRHQPDTKVVPADTEALEPVSDKLQQIRDLIDRGITGTNAIYREVGGNRKEVSELIRQERERRGLPVAA